MIPKSFRNDSGMIPERFRDALLSLNGFFLRIGAFSV